MPPSASSVVLLSLSSTRPILRHAQRSNRVYNVWRLSRARLSLQQDSAGHRDSLSLSTFAPARYRKRLRNPNCYSMRCGTGHPFTTGPTNTTSRRAGPDRIAGSPDSYPRDKLKTKDRGPASTEDTQTDFGELNVLGSIAPPATSVDICLFDGFQLGSGLQVGDGDGVMLVSGEGLVWRPWMAKAHPGEPGAAAQHANHDLRGSKAVINGAMLSGATEVERSGGVLNKSGQFEVADECWGVFKMLWPRPDLLIIGTGPTIRPLAPSTRNYLQNLGMRIEVLDTRNAASQFNMLATERGITEVAAALVPIGFGLK